MCTQLHSVVWQATCSLRRVVSSIALVVYFREPKRPYNCVVFPWPSTFIVGVVAAVVAVAGDAVVVGRNLLFTVPCSCMRRAHQTLLQLLQNAHPHRMHTNNVPLAQIWRVRTHIHTEKKHASTTCMQP